MEWILLQDNSNKMDDIVNDSDVIKSSYMARFHRHILLLVDKKLAIPILMKFGELRVPVINFKDRFEI